ncbi:MAG: glycosyltransferase [Deltaproteobacteria bacterium]|nr:glycosyltransferase [Deltaproteobacteria bacterium]
MDQYQCTNGRLADSRFMQALYHKAQASLCYSDDEYIRLNPDAAGLPLSPFEHCCRFALREQRKVSDFFDPAWYHRRYCAGIPDCNPVAHFFSYGIFTGLKGAPLSFGPELLARYAKRYFDRVEAVPFLELPWSAPLADNGGPLREQAHIVFVVHELLRTGASLTLLQAMQELAKKPGLTLWSLLMLPGPMEDDFRAASRALPMHEVRRATRFPMFSAMQIIQGFAALPGKQKCLVPNTITIPKYFSTLAGLAGIPAIPWIHELPGFLPFFWKNNEVDQLCREAAAVMTSSRFCGERLSSYLEEHEPPPAGLALEVTGTPVDAAAVKLTKAEAAAVRRSLALPAAGPLVLGCGYISKVKGTDIFARVAALAARRADVTFAWTGGASTDEDEALLEALREAARETGARLHFLGRVGEMWPLYACSSLFLCTSRVDSFPRVVVEAKLAGLPIVCLGGNNGAVECLNPPADAIVGREDPAALLQAVLQRLPQPGAPIRLPTPAPRPEFSPRAVADRVFEIISRRAFAGMCLH